MKMVHQPLPKDYNPEYKMGIDRALRIIEILSELLEKSGYKLDINAHGVYYEKRRGCGLITF